jgi:hypothetical protein
LFSFFRKKAKNSDREVKASEMGYALLQIVFSSEASNKAALQFLKDSDDAVNQKVLNEVFCLRVFAIDTAVTNTLGETPEKDGVLAAFYDNLKSLSEEFSWKDLGIRLSIYEEAFQTPHHRGAAFQVGKAFARFCGYEMDAAVMLGGGNEFTATVVTVSDLVKSWHIIV